VRELEAGLWHWEAPHPDWSPEQPWPCEVSSYAIDDGVRLLLFDPLGVPPELLELAGHREPVVVLTTPWHERDAPSLVELLGAALFAPQSGTHGAAGRAHLFGAGDRLPLGIDVFPGRDHDDLVLWLESRRAVVPGDTLADFGRGLHIPEQWLWGDVTRGQVVEGLRPLLELPVERILPTHGPPTDRAALERALS